MFYPYFKTLTNVHSLLLTKADIMTSFQSHVVSLTLCDIFHAPMFTVSHIIFLIFSLYSNANVMINVYLYKM